MANLLCEIGTYRIRAHTIWKTRLYVYEDHVVYKKRFWFTTDEITVTYNHIAQANTQKGVFFTKLTLINSGGAENIEIKYVLNHQAIKAKKIIDQKIHQAYITSSPKGEFQHKKTEVIDTFERGLGRLKELLARGSITQKEFEKKRKQMLKNMD